MMCTYLHFAGGMMMLILMGCNQNAKDSKRRHTSPAVEPVSLMPGSDQQEDNELHSETPAECAEMKETKLAVLSWEQMDIFLPHDGASGEDGC
jgi:hypothetical protein